MLFAWDISVTAGTAEATPLLQALKLTRGVITRIDVKFPPGVHGLVKVRLLRSEFQLVPLSRGEWVTGDAETVVTETYYKLTYSPTQLKFVGCSPNTTYAHTITVRVTLQPEEAAEAWETLRDLVIILKRVMGLG